MSEGSELGFGLGWLEGRAEMVGPVPRGGGGGGGGRGRWRCSFEAEAFAERLLCTWLDCFFLTSYRGFCIFNNCLLFSKAI